MTLGAKRLPNCHSELGAGVLALHTLESCLKTKLLIINFNYKLKIYFTQHVGRGRAQRKE